MPDLPRAPGAYVLIVALDAPLALTGHGPVDAILDPGTYAYCGSARGPGGIRARVQRHLRPDKRPHWHVDRLTDAGRVVSVRAVPGGRECDLLHEMLAVPGAMTPVPGFGSTDCRRCPSHLVQLPATPEGGTPC